MSTWNIQRSKIPNNTKGAKTCTNGQSGPENSFGNCFIERKVDYVREKCGCWPLYTPESPVQTDKMDGAGICSKVQHETCVDFYDNFEPSGCFDACTRRQFEITQTSAELPAEYTDLHASTGRWM
ncbi:MAG: amiloride-sensitive sodium channel family protein [Mesoflavibacter sp.]|nr:amiloride-sensitive sodium channel family protein [Mesoflavibacter sp.]